MEDTGYMARVAFMLDKSMTKMGLHGKSILPLMSGYACAIPGIMSTRTIDSWKERLVTILILPLMSCSARLPVYTLLISAFIPPITLGGYLNLQGLTLVVMYFLGTATALILAKVFSKFIKEKTSSSFVLELPPYHVPIPRSVLRHVFIRGKLFLINAGKIIMAISIVLWFLASFPKVDQPITDANPIHYSYAGKIGHAIEPVIRPLGFDWKIGIGLLTSFAAREVMVSTMATIYNVEDTGDNIVNLREAMRSDIDVKKGTISCRWHKTSFCYKTGDVKEWMKIGNFQKMLGKMGLNAEAEEISKMEHIPVDVYKTKVQDGFVWIGMESKE